VALQNIAAPNLDVRQRHGRRIAANVGIGFIAGGEKEIEAEAQDGDSVGVGAKLDINVGAKPDRL